MSLLTRLFYTFATFLVLSSSLVSAKSVFVHYMLQDIKKEHANQDIVEAKAMGFDAFAVNVHAPNEPWTDPALDRLFASANANGFKLFISMDLNVHSNWQDFKGILSKYLGNSAYFTGTWNKKPLISSFGAGNMGPSNMTDFKYALGNEVYFCPGADLTSGYYSDPHTWFDLWNTGIDGTFSWNAAWPWADFSNPLNLLQEDDMPIMNAAKKFEKGYMMGISSVQYKRIGDQNFYRAGEEQMVRRMNNILQLGKTEGTWAPEFLQFISWNDAGESHYLGNIWEEGVGSDVLRYANNGAFDHSGWKSLVTSFIQAYKAGSQAMAPVNGTNSAIGSIWYRPVMKNAPCKGAKPSGWQGAKDAINYAYVLPANAQGYKLSILGTTIDLKGGLNYGSVQGLTAGGPQSATLTDGGGNVVSVAQGKISVTDDANSDCNFNFGVFEARAPGGSSASTTVKDPAKRAGLLERAMKDSTVPKEKRKRHVGHRHRSQRD